LHTQPGTEPRTVVSGIKTQLSQGEVVP
jgi:hypothetical protein